MQTLYMKAEPGKIAPYVIFSGDPWRIEVLKTCLSDVEKIGFFREFNTYTGRYKDLKVTVTSTGIGSPSAAIAMEEMYEVGMKVAVRMGTAMALDEKMLGQFLIPAASMRRESTSKTYVEESYPAVADPDLLRVMDEAVKGRGKSAYNGVTCTMDGYYSQMHDSRLSRERGVDLSHVFDELRALHVDGADMESSCILTLGRLMGVKTCVVTLVTVLENLKASLPPKERAEAEKLLCEVVLAGLKAYSLECPAEVFS